MLATLKGIYIAIEEEVKSLVSWFNSEQEEDKPKKKYTRDCTQLNQYHYDFVVAAHAEFKQFNEGKSLADRKPISELTDRLNDRFGLNKSTRSYQRIWTGHLKREELPQGKLDFEW